MCSGIDFEFGGLVGEIILFNSEITTIKYNNLLINKSKYQI